MAEICVGECDRLAVKTQDKVFTVDEREGARTARTQVGPAVLPTAEVPIIRLALAAGPGQVQPMLKTSPP
jgi:hypothetical protein